ncbi:MAG TPA: hypothetical protein VNZ52_01330 [Candidatus Thermoplasmatota archaeon]|nr:hypothetical protein [Candidatus Thermoplasmatota archaeon]
MGWMPTPESRRRDAEVAAAIAHNVYLFALDRFLAARGGERPAATAFLGEALSNLHATQAELRSRRHGNA